MWYLSRVPDLILEYIILYIYSSSSSFPVFFYLLQVPLLSLQLQSLLEAYTRRDAEVSPLPTLLSPTDSSRLHNCQECHSE